MQRTIYVWVALLLTLSTMTSLGQANIRKLPTSINHPGINLYCPYMSFDGDGLVYVSDNAEDYELVPFYTYRDGGDWREPIALPRLLHSKSSYLKGYTLGPEGRILYITTLKSPGVGGFDIWVSERKGSTWTEPRNLAAPINSKSHEASPTLTPDGMTMYFMRCDKMDQKSASGCKLMVATKKTNGQWNEPQEMPQKLNTGNSQTPRILADGETLLFASDKMAGGKGGMDLYMTRNKDGQWSDPIAMAFINTEKDDQFVSVNAQGRYLLRDAPGSRKNELVEYLIPDTYRPKGMLRVDGRVTVQSVPPVATYVSATDQTTGKRVFSGRPAHDGSFTIFLLEGSIYEVSVDPELGNFTYFTKRYDLTTDLPQVDRITPAIGKVEPGLQWDLTTVDFEPQSGILSDASDNELKRVARLVKSCPESSFEVQVLLAGYEEDSIQSGPDLTELVIDSVMTTVDDIDSLGQLFQRDTIIVHTTYHNDRTDKQANAVVEFLVSQGIDRNKLSYFVNSRPVAVDERKRVEVKIRTKS